MSAPVQLPTLDQVSTLLPAPQAALADAILASEPHEALVQFGAEMKSSRILTDSARMLGLAYAVWIKATDAQKAALVGFSPELLSIAVDRALALRDLVGDAGDAEHLDVATLEARAAAARVAFDRGLSRRDHAERVLRIVAGRDAKLRACVEAAVGKADTAEALSLGLGRLAKLGRELVASSDPVVQAKVMLTRLDKAYFDQLDVLAADVLATARAAGVRASAAKASQGDIDLLDGINLTLLGMIINAFEGAHALDPTIPRLVPIATRRLLGKRRRAADSVETPAKPCESSDPSQPA